MSPPNIPRDASSNTQWGRGGSRLWTPKQAGSPGGPYPIQVIKSVSALNLWWTVIFRSSQKKTLLPSIKFLYWWLTSPVFFHYHWIQLQINIQIPFFLSFHPRNIFHVSAHTNTEQQVQSKHGTDVFCWTGMLIIITSSWQTSTFKTICYIKILQWKVAISVSCMSL